MRPRTIADVIAHVGRQRAPLPRPEYAPPGSGGRRIMLAMEAHRRHMTDEAWQLTLGLSQAGYTLCGHGLEVNETDCRKIAAGMSPITTVVIQDKREWEGLTGGRRKDPRYRFTNLGALAALRQTFRVTVLKDSHAQVAYHAQGCREMAIHAWVVYYHPQIVASLAPYVRPADLVRTYHTVDPQAVPAFSPHRSRMALLSGALSAAYPLRRRLVQQRAKLSGVDVLPHPGYHERGPATPAYLEALSQYRVAICTASVYGYALRKLIEATACGCVVVTDLPTDDVLPEIDENLVRISPEARTEEIGDLVADLARRYDPDRQREFAARAVRRYNYAAECSRLAVEIERMRESYAGDSAYSGDG